MASSLGKACARLARNAGLFAGHMTCFRREAGNLVSINGGLSSVVHLYFPVRDLAWKRSRGYAPWSPRVTIDVSDTLLAGRRESAYR